MELSADTSLISRSRVTGHFGEWLQGRMAPDGPVVLVSLPCPEMHCTVKIAEAPAFSITSPHPVLTETRIRQVLQMLSTPETLSVSVSGNIPFGAGLGASTAALIALIKATSSKQLTNEQITEICLQIEGASDPLMQDDFATLLWASRQGTIKQRFAAPPAFEIVGGLWGEGEKTNPNDTRFPDIADLIPRWAQAAQNGDPIEIAHIASESAHRTTALRGPDEDPTEQLTAELGALGHIRAHTGSARGLLFKPEQVPANAEERLKAFGYTHITRFKTGA